MNKTRSKVMTIANRLVKQGLTRSMATLKAWIIVKANALRTKVRGTSRRQNALEKLAEVNPADISVKLKREPRNSHDSNAVAVYAALRDNRVFFIGYLPKAVAAFSRRLWTSTLNRILRRSELQADLTRMCITARLWQLPYEKSPYITANQSECKGVPSTMGAGQYYYSRPAPKCQ